MKVLDQLRSLDDRVVGSRSPMSRRWFWAPLIMPVMFGSFALLDPDRPDARALWLACAASAYGAGRQVIRTQTALLAEGQDLPLHRLRAASPFLVAVAALSVGVSFSPFYRASPSASREVDAVRARALVQTVLDLAGSGDRSDVCEVARDESACREKVASAPAPPVGSPEIFKVLPLGEGKTTAVAVYFASTSPPAACVLVVVNDGGGLVVENPAYWVDDCHS